MSWSLVCAVRILEIVGVTKLKYVLILLTLSPSCICGAYVISVSSQTVKLSVMLNGRIK